MNLPNDLQFAVDVSRRAGALALSHYGRVDRLTKSHAATTDEAVTVADRKVQQLIVAALREHAPADAVIGEEDATGSGITNTVADPDARCWVIDPIDGTNNFIAGTHNWAVCVGLLHAGRPVLGVVYDPVRDELFAGAQGHGATLNGRPTAARPDAMSASTMLMLTSNLIGHGRSGAPRWAELWLGQTEYKVRMLGSAALEAVQVAAGRAHAAITVNGKLWDAVAPCAIVLAAGGRVTTLAGEDRFPYDLAGYTGAKVPFVAAAPLAAPAVLEHLRSNP
ncbi:MAG: inositol monophosphatase family protein [Phycisphaerae bacterium]